MRTGTGKMQQAVKCTFRVYEPSRSHSRAIKRMRLSTQLQQGDVMDKAGRRQVPDVH